MNITTKSQTIEYLGAIKVIGEIMLRKITDTSDIEQGDILRDPVTNALFEVIKVDFGMALLEIKTKSSQILREPSRRI